MLNKIIAFAFLLTFFTSHGYALEKKRKVVLLSAIHNIPDTELYHEVAHYFWHNMDQDQYDIQVVHGALQEDLYHQLNDPENFAVFWLSHSGSHSEIDALSSVITDSNGVNVKAIFQKVHPSIRWVGIVGCKSKKIAEKFEKTNTHGQKFFGDTGFLGSGFTTPMRGIKQAIKDFKKSTMASDDHHPHKTNNKEVCRKQRGIMLKVSGVSSLEFPMQLLHKDSFVTLFSKNLYAEDEGTVFLPTASTSHLKFRLNTGQEPSSFSGPVDHGDFNITTLDGKISFLPLKNKKGKIIGKTSYLYKPERALSEDYIQTYEQCENP